MSSRSALLAASLPCLLLVSGAAVEVARAADPVGLYDPAQLPGFDGQVQQFTLSPRGDIDGLILKDGTEVKTPPHLSTAIAYAVKPGDTVTIHGLRAAALPLVQAAAITDHASGRTIVDTGPAPRPVGIGPTPGTNADGVTEVQGAVRMSLHGARGEINGVLLQDGTVLRFPPDAAPDMTNLLQPGKSVVAEGAQVMSPVGKVMEVSAIGTSRANLMPVAGPPDPGPRGRGRLPGPRPDAPPPPPPPGT